jgi:hypothetical protein
VPESVWVDLGPVARDHPTRLELGQAGLHRAAGDAEAPGYLEEAEPRMGAQLGYEA